MIALMAPCAPGNRYLLAARTLWLSDLTRVAAHRFDAMGYNVPTKVLPYAALWAASYVDPTLSNILPNIGVKALTDVEVRTGCIGDCFAPLLLVSAPHAD